MKLTGKKIALVAALVAVLGASVATPARADWNDGHRWHHGHVAHGWRWDARLGYYVYAPAYVPAPVVVAQPAPVYVAPQPVYAQPVYVEPQPPPPIGLSLHIH